MYKHGIYHDSYCHNCHEPRPSHEVINDGEKCEYCICGELGCLKTAEALAEYEDGRTEKYCMNHADKAWEKHDDIMGVA